MNDGKELREYTRIEMKVEVEITQISNQEKRIGDTECVSMSGLFIDCDHPFPVGTECEITVFIGGRESEVLVEAKGTVAYVDALGMAVEFQSHLGLDSYKHLRNLVLYNANQDAEIVETEIEAHLGRIRGA